MTLQRLRYGSEAVRLARRPHLATAAAGTAMLIALSGCAGLNYAVENYHGVRVDEIEMPDDTYRIFDKPAENRMMITPSLGAAMGVGVTTGLTYGAADNVAPKPRFEAAALQYLREEARGDCKVVDFYLIARPQFEIKYQCPNPPLPNPPPRPKIVHAPVDPQGQ
jgi:hypothetical protein